MSNSRLDSYRKIYLVKKYLEKYRNVGAPKNLKDALRLYLFFLETIRPEYFSNIVLEKFIDITKYLIAKCMKQQEEYDILYQWYPFGPLNAGNWKLKNHFHNDNEALKIWLIVYEYYFKSHFEFYGDDIGRKFVKLLPTDVEPLPYNSNRCRTESNEYYIREYTAKSLVRNTNTERCLVIRPPKDIIVQTGYRRDIGPRKESGHEPDEYLLRKDCLTLVSTYTHRPTGGYVDDCYHIAKKYPDIYDDTIHRELIVPCTIMSTDFKDVSQFYRQSYQGGQSVFGVPFSWFVGDLGISYHDLDSRRCAPDDTPDCEIDCIDLKHRTRYRKASYGATVKSIEDAISRGVDMYNEYEHIRDILKIENNRVNILDKEVLERVNALALDIGEKPIKMPSKSKKKSKSSEIDWSKY